MSTEQEAKEAWREHASKDLTDPSIFAVNSYISGISSYQAALLKKLEALRSAYTIMQQSIVYEPTGAVELRIQAYDEIIKVIKTLKP